MWGKSEVPVTHLRKIMLEELQRRDDSPGIVLPGCVLGLNVGIPAQPPSLFPSPDT
jgi:hypothetical protein